MSKMKQKCVTRFCCNDRRFVNNGNGRFPDGKEDLGPLRLDVLFSWGLDLVVSEKKTWNQKILSQDNSISS